MSKFKKDCFTCNECIPIGEGDRICGVDNSLIIDEYAPTEHYCWCENEKKELSITNIIKCRFLDKDGQPRGREYSYKTNTVVKVGQLVDVPVSSNSDVDIEQKTKAVIVTQINVPESEIISFADRIKTIIGIHKDTEDVRNV